MATSSAESSVCQSSTLRSQPMNETSTPPGWKAYGSIASFKVLVEDSKFWSVCRGHELLELFAAVQICSLQPVVPRIVPGNATMWLGVPVCYPARAGLPRHPPRVVRSSAETAGRGDRPAGHWEHGPGSPGSPSPRSCLDPQEPWQPRLCLLEELESLDRFPLNTLFVND